MVMLIVTIVFIISFLLLIGCISGVKDRNREIKTISSMRADKIRLAQQGFRRLEGRAKILPNIQSIAPLSGKRCVWYYYKVRAVIARHKSMNMWKIVDQKSSPYMLQISDGTGSCIIDLLDAEFYLKSGKFWKKGSYEGPYESSPIADEHFEARIDEDDMLIIYGDFNRYRRVEDVWECYESKYSPSQNIEGQKPIERPALGKIRYYQYINSTGHDGPYCQTVYEKIPEERVETLIARVRTVFASILKNEGEVNLMSNPAQKKRPLLITNLPMQLTPQPPNFCS